LGTDHQSVQSRAGKV